MLRKLRAWSRQKLGWSSCFVIFRPLGPHCGPAARPIVAEGFTALAGIATLRAKGVRWKRIAAQMGLGVGTLYQEVRLRVMLGASAQTESWGGVDSATIRMLDFGQQFSLLASM